MSDPAVSVVIPAYNAAAFISPALDSVLAQTFAEPVEIIVVDDGSKDDTAGAVARYGDRVRFIRQTNGGAASARNAGIRAARAPWLAFLDADDMWQPDHLARLLAAAGALPEAHLAYGTKQWVDQSGTPLPNLVPPSQLPAGWIFADLYEDCVVSTCSTVLARTDTVRALDGFSEDPRFRVTQDYDLYLRLAARHAVASDPAVRVLYRRHDGNLTNLSVSLARGHLAALHTAERLLDAGQVAAANHPERLDRRDRMRRAYRDAVVSLFNAGDYAGTRQVGGEAVRRGLITPELASRSLLSLLPPPVLGRLRRAARLGFKAIRR